MRPSGSHLEGYVPDFCRGWGILRLSLPEAEIFIMSNLDLQIFTRNPATGKEREPRAGWTEFPKQTTGYYNTDLPVWKPEGGDPWSGVYLDLIPNGVAVISRKAAEVFLGQVPVIKREKPFRPIQQPDIIIIPATARNELERTEIVFDKAGVNVELSIVVDGQPVKEVRVVSVVSE